MVLTLFGIYGGLRTSKMTDWFHRNHLKATAKYTFDVGAVAKDLSCKTLCSDAAKRRVELLKLISDPSVPCEAVITSLNRYLQLLMGFVVATDNKTPFSKLRGLVCVKWCDSIKPKGEPIVSEDEAKDVHLSLKTAAGLFNLLRTKYMHEFTEFVPNSDMDPNILDAYINQSLAEAQEITVARAIELKHKPYLIAGLANETAKLYEKCGLALTQCNPKIVGKWKKYSEFKQFCYESYAYVYYGEDLLEKGKAGQAVAILKEASAPYEKAIRAAREYTKVEGVSLSTKPPDHCFFRRLPGLIERTHNKCERENGLIYHQKVPSVAPFLEIKAEYGIAAPKEPELNFELDPRWKDAYVGFDTSKVVENILSNSKNSKDHKHSGTKDEPVEPVREMPIFSTDKDPKNDSGCVIS
ncbi:unnamed protein product [Schistosoma margrebowiei]|uniref:BRO1 domain-containing protein n=1 Tax=Schistosoma margrebowiei TaxID=48269 RepID=A0A3P8CD28_9TREM|nr:unnamed protein product [Schistosoma margrebowiei]